MSTPVKINNPDAKTTSILLAPLDWGLGHVTRCIPIIKELINQNCTVIAAVSGAQKVLLAHEFPDLRFEELPGYGIKYDKNRALTVFRLIVSIPKILIAVNREKRWLRQFVRRERPDLIISDNRYGLYDEEVVSVFITHQLMIRTPFGPVVDRWLQRINYRLIRRFSLCWVPDVEGRSDGLARGSGLAGELSHPRRMPAVPVRYIGWLSRFGGSDHAAGAGIDLLVLLSGPEPQRTLLEKKIVEQLADYSGRTVLVRGLPGGGGSLGLPAGDGGVVVPERVIVYDHLPAVLLEKLIEGAGLVIARSGYSTVMDLMRLGKRAILIPTPGQTEQEYLGNYLASKGWAISIEQRGFLLADAMAVARSWRGAELPEPGTGEGLLREEIVRMLERVRGGLAGDGE